VQKGAEELKHVIRELEKGWQKCGIKPEEPKKPHKTHLSFGRWSDIYVDSTQGEMLRNTCSSISWVSQFTGTPVPIWSI
jgi:hypothetical protein